MIGKTKQLIIHSLPLVFGIILSYLFWRFNTFLLGIYIILVLSVILVGKDKKAELSVFIYGAVVGFFIETIGTKISGYQNFINPDILGIPYWLIVAWGYGFILMKRVSLIITAGSPWVRK